MIYVLHAFMKKSTKGKETPRKDMELISEAAEGCSDAPCERGPTMIRKPASTRGSGNPFADLGMADADTRLAKARLAQKITSVMREKNLTQEQIAEKLGIDQPRVSRITRGQLTDVSLGKLLALVNRLNVDIEITLAPNPEPSRPARLAVTDAQHPLRAGAADQQRSGVDAASGR